MIGRPRVKKKFLKNVGNEIGVEIVIFEKKILGGTLALALVEK